MRVGPIDNRGFEVSYRLSAAPCSGSETRDEA